MINKFMIANHQQYCDQVVLLWMTWFINVIPSHTFLFIYNFTYDMRIYLELIFYIFHLNLFAKLTIYNFLDVI